jgi:hypothetical protein
VLSYSTDTHLDLLVLCKSIEDFTSTSSNSVLRPSRVIFLLLVSNYSQPTVNLVFWYYRHRQLAIISSGMATISVSTTAINISRALKPLTLLDFIVYIFILNVSVHLEHVFHIFGIP